MFILLGTSADVMLPTIVSRCQCVPFRLVSPAVAAQAVSCLLYTSYPRVDNTVYPATLDLGAVVSDLAKINPALAPVCKKVLAGPMKPDRKSTRLNSSHLKLSRMPSSA